MEFKKENYRQFELNRLVYDVLDKAKSPEAPKKKEFKPDMEFTLEEADPEGAKLEATRLDQEAKSKGAEAIQSKQNEIDKYLKPDGPEVKPENKTDERSMEDLMVKAEAKEDVVKTATEKPEKAKSFDQMSPSEIIGTFLALINSPVFKEAFKTGDYQTIMDVIDDFSHTRNPQETMNKAKTLFEEKLATMNVNDMISLYREPRGAESKKLFGEKQPYLIQLRTVIESKLKNELGLSQNATMTMDSTVDNRVVFRTTKDDKTYEIKIDGTNQKVSKSEIILKDGTETKTPIVVETAFDGSLANLAVKLGTSTPTETPAQDSDVAENTPADTKASDAKTPEADDASKKAGKKVIPLDEIRITANTSKSKRGKGNKNS